MRRVCTPKTKPLLRRGAGLRENTQSGNYRRASMYLGTATSATLATILTPMKRSMYLFMVCAVVLIPCIRRQQIVAQQIKATDAGIPNVMIVDGRTAEGSCTPNPYQTSRTPTARASRTVARSHGRALSRRCLLSLMASMNLSPKKRLYREQCCLHYSTFQFEKQYVFCRTNKPQTKFCN